MGDTRMRALLERLRWQRIGRLLPSPRRSVASRIVFSVFVAALVTGLAVTWISSRSTESFLRRKIDQKFPVVLRSSAEHLDLWYSQRELDVTTFARSATVIESLRGLARRRGADAEELERYLGYVLEQFPQYESLFLLDAGAGVLMEVGATLELPEPVRQRLTSVSAARLEAPVALRGRRLQIVSARVSK